MGFTVFFSAPGFAAGLSGAGASLSCQSCVTFSQSYFFNQTNQISWLRPALRSEINPSFEPSALQKGLPSFRGCIETFTRFPELSAACIKTSSLKYKSVSEYA